MKLCPDDTLWQALLQETLPDDSVENLRTHLVACQGCQQTMDRLSDTDRTFPTVVVAEIAQPSRHFLERLKSQHASRLAVQLLEPLTHTEESFGHIERGELIGRGGMGSVYRGRDRQAERDVAIKLLHISDAPDSQRVMREATAAAKVRHDHLVPLLSLGHTPDGTTYLVMPLIEGPSLRQELQARRLLPAVEAAKLTRDLADGLAALHAAGIVHRDVKPANILLDRADGRAKLTDFGLAATIDRTTTIAGSLGGTPEYMAPERFEAQATPQPSNDVFSLGATLYEMLTGTPPYRGEVLAILRQAQTGDPLRPRILNPNIPRDLETITLRALQPDVTKRYDTIAAMRDDLTRWLEGRPILARPVGFVERSFKWMRRHPAPTAALVSLGLLVIGLGVGIAWVDAARSRAQQAESLAADRLRDEEVATQQAKESLQKVIASNLAREEAEKVRAAVSSFFVNDVMMNSQSSESLSEKRTQDVTVRSLLDRVSKTVGTKFAAEPKIEAAIRFQLSISYSAFGLDQEALGHIQRAAELNDKHFGPTASETLNSQARWAWVLSTLSRYPEAIRMLENVLAVSENADTKNEAVANDTRQTLAMVLDHAGQVPRAMKLMEEIHAYRLKTHGERDFKTLIAAMNLAGVYNRMGRIPDAEKLLQKTLPMAVETLGENHLTTGLIINSLAIAISQRDMKESLPFFERSLKISMNLDGPSHPRTLIARGNLAMTTGNAQDYNTALKLYEVLLKDCAETFPGAHPTKIKFRGDYGFILSIVGRDKEAAKIQAENVADYDALELDRTLEGIRARLNLGESLTTTRDFIKALSILEMQAYPRALDAFGPKHWLPSNIQSAIASCYSEMGQHLMAHHKWQALLEQDRPLRPPTDTQFQFFLYEAGICAITIKNYADAVKNFEELLPRMEQYPSAIFRQRRSRFYLAYARHELKPNTADRKAMQTILDDPKASTNDKLLLGPMLLKLYQGAGDTAKAEALRSKIPTERAPQPRQRP
jgi:tetratricopeptide (TPR) repeat protein